LFRLRVAGVVLSLAFIKAASSNALGAVRRRSFLRALPFAAVPIGLSPFANAAISDSNSAGTGTFWSGWAHMARVADVGLANIEVTCFSAFRFTLDAAGSLIGEASASYDIRIDDGKLRGILAAATSTFYAAITQSSAWAGLLGAGASRTDLLGVGIAFNNGTEIRQNAISGRLDGSKLRISWAEAPPRLEYQISRVYVNREVVAKKDTAPAYAPWLIDGAVSPAGKDAVYAVGAGQRKTGEVRESGIWSAVRIR
jgi:hypothetical protein